MIDNPVPRRLGLIAGFEVVAVVFGGEPGPEVDAACGFDLGPFGPEEVEDAGFGSADVEIFEAQLLARFL